VYHRKISKRKYYGTKVLIKKYSEYIIGSLPDVSKPRFQEGLEDDIADRFFTDVKFNTDDVKPLFEDAFLKGTRRVFNLQGEQISPVEQPASFAIDSLLDDQKNHIVSMSRRLGQKAREKVASVLEKGGGSEDARREVQSLVEDRSRYEAERIARSEIIKASSEGIRETMKDLGVSHVVWLATMDDRVCPICSDLHMSSYRINGAPTPVEDTHPNCRCTLVVDTEKGLNN
jgi:SPP1 gp7 family putative phage head morphogenesis protein